MEVATAQQQQQYYNNNRMRNNPVTTPPTTKISGTDLLNVFFKSANKSKPNNVVVPVSLVKLTPKVVGGGIGVSDNQNLQQQHPKAQQTTQSNSNNIHLSKISIPSDILDDLASRFIINVPDDERNNLIRICFQIELAHWFYLDFFCAIEERKLIQCGMKIFAVNLFQHIPFLQKHLTNLDKILDDWKNYKLSVPTYGAILVSEDLSCVLLVQSYLAKSSWGFPKGKVNENEDPVHCAIREVYEETGYDITNLIVPKDFIEANINYQTTRLYIVRNVPIQTQFTPRTRNEIKCCDWFPIDSLPTNKSDAISKQINANSFFMIIPFIKRLKKWITDVRSGIESNRKISTTSASSSSTSPISQLLDCGGGVAGCNNGSSNGDNNKLNKNKRQRHKSMGDIDGIKLNLSNNNNGGTKYIKNNNNVNHHNHQQQQQNPTTPNGCNTNDYYYWSTTTTATTATSVTATSVTATSAKKVANNLKNNSSSNSINSNNSKRQLFNSNNDNNLSATTKLDDVCINSGVGGGGGVGVVGVGGCRKSQSSFDLIRREKQMQLQQQKNVNKKTNNSARTRTKSQTNLVEQQKSKQQQQNSTKTPTPPIVDTSSSTVTTTTTNQQILKFDPSFDSWTNFSFTKNIITNVFC